MITSITKEQKTYFKKLIDKTRKDYLNFNTNNKDIAKSTIKKLYALMGQSEPIIISAQNPIELQLKVLLLSRHLDNKPGSRLDSTLNKKLSSALYCGVFWRYWVTYYEFSLSIGVDLDLEKLQLLKDFAYHCPLIVPFSKICFYIENPKNSSFKNQKLHNTNGAAIEFNSSSNATKFDIYSIDGITVPKWLVTTPSHELKPEDYLTLTNADVKACFIEKFGIERMKALGTVIDTWGKYSNHINYDIMKKSQYELIDMGAIDDLGYIPYLGMINQTTGMYHLEAVSNQDKTILEALKTRWNGRDFNEYKTVSIK